MIAIFLGSTILFPNEIAFEHIYLHSLHTNLQMNVTRHGLNKELVTSITWPDDAGVQIYTADCNSIQIAISLCGIYGSFANMF